MRRCRRLEHSNVHGHGRACELAPPRAGELAADHDGRAEHATAGVDSSYELRIEHRVSIAVRDEILVERGEQICGAAGNAHRNAISPKVRSTPRDFRSEL